jgi:Flp pilus assembly protein protease CpaA
MEFGFLFWLFLGGIIVASMQDLKRREVDNWLNLLLLVSGLVFVFFGAILRGEPDIIFLATFLLVVMFFVMNLFYYGRVFAGGDAKLLLAMTMFFLGVNFWESVGNIGIFLLFLMLAGSIYGLVYSFVLWLKNMGKVNKEMARVARANHVKYLEVLGVVLMLLGFVDFLFFLIGAFIFIFPLLYVFAKGLENISMIREISGKELREGDWLVKDIKIGRNVIKADWDGLSLKDIELLKGKKKVMIKEGLPFVPAFLIAFLLYVFLKEWFIELLISLA